MARKRGTGGPVKTLSKSEVAALNKKLGPRGKGVRSRISQKERVLSTGKGWGRDTKVEHSEERERQRRKPYGRKSDASNTAGEKQKARTGRVSDARTRVGGGSPGSRVAGGLARFKGR